MLRTLANQLYTPTTVGATVGVIYIFADTKLQIGFITHQKIRSLLNEDFAAPQVSTFCIRVRAFLKRQ